MDWENALLNRDPFLIEAPVDDLAMVWADMTTVKSELEEVVRALFVSAVTQLVLNRGRWGGGKTHAAHYFLRPDNLLAVYPFDGPIVPVYVRTPIESGNASEQFYEDVLDQLGWEDTRDALISFKDRVGEEVFIQRIRRATNRPDLVSAFTKFADSLFDLALIRRYFLGAPLTASEVRSLQVARRMPSGAVSLKISTLALFLRARIGALDGTPTGRAIIWVDETEDLNFYPSRDLRVITSLWRDLLDGVPIGLTLFLNYTPLRAESRLDLLQIFGNALASRITKTIEFRPLSPDDANRYVRELLNTPIYRSQLPEDYGLPPTYPFTEELVSRVIADSERFELTPRVLNLAFGTILKQCLVTLRPDRTTLIGIEFADQAMADVQSILAKDLQDESAT